jgi:hypothetical protein
MKKSRNALIFLALTPAAFCAGGCMHATRTKHPQLPAGEEIRVEGTLGQQEFGCLTVRTADGQRFNLAREIEGSRPGQNVWIQGYVVKTKGCMPGPTLMPRQAGLLEGTAVVLATKGTTR